MPKQRYTTEEIIHKLREMDVLLGQGKTIAEATKQVGVTDKTYFRWRKTHGGMRIDQAKRLRELEAENGRLKRAVADLTVDKIILKEVAEGTIKPSALPRSRGAGALEAPVLRAADLQSVGHRQIGDSLCAAAARR
jgi:putative transposase